MKRVHLFLAIFLVSLMSIFTTSYAQMQKSYINEHGQTIIVTTAPAPKETVTIPEGYVNCFTVPAGWNYKNIWVAEHKLCQYTSVDGTAIQGVAWVDGYWACSQYRTLEQKKGECTNWEWQSGRWVKSLDIY